MHLPCTRKSAQIGCFLKCRESFVQEMLLTGVCWESFVPEMLLTGVCWESFLPGVVVEGCAGRVFYRVWRRWGCAGRVFCGTAAGRAAVGELFCGRIAEGPHGERVYVRSQSLRPPLVSRGQISHAIPLKVFQVMKSNR